MNSLFHVHVHMHICIYIHAQVLDCTRHVEGGAEEDKPEIMITIKVLFNLNLQRKVNYLVGNSFLKIVKLYKFDQLAQVRDEQGPVTFKLKKTTKLEKVLTAYCKQR